MTSARAYRPGSDSGDAIRELWRCAGTQFDAEAVQSLVRRPRRGRPWHTAGSCPRSIK